ncbi:MAG: hypothetical protein IJI26_02040 [Clostridia bacterium]|nr:hypothetical protein [Clostridia bacterium]
MAIWKDLIKVATSEAAGKMADAYIENKRLGLEDKRLELEKEHERQKIEEKKREARWPIMIVLIILCIIALAIIWILPPPEYGGRIGAVFGTIVLIPLLIYFIKKL